METYIVRIIDDERSQFNGYINVDDNYEFYGEAIQKGCDLKFSLLGFLNKEKLSLNILSKEENISIEASRCDSFPKSTISINSDLFFGKSIDMCEDSTYIELTNVELLDMRPNDIRIDSVLVKYADLLDADIPRVCLGSLFDSDIPEIESTVPEKYRKSFIHTEESFAYKFCMSREQQKQIKQKKK